MDSAKNSLKDKSGLPILLDGNSLVFEEYLEEVKPSIRTLEQMRPVLKDGKISSPSECYYMYRNVCREENREMIEGSGLRHDITVIPALMLGSEFNKTFGHFHPKQPEKEVSYPEVYEVLYGRGHFILQAEDSTKFFVIDAKAGEKVLIPPGFGHVTINPSKECLVVSNWVCSGFESDYSVFEKKNGAIYYETKGGWVENKKYPFLPQIEYEDPQDLSALGFEENVPMYKMVNSLEKLDFLKNPDKHKYLLASLGP